MNPVRENFIKIIISINKIIDNIDIRTVEMIKKTFYFLSFILVIVGIIIGFYWGKGDAKRDGGSLAEYTNISFDIDIRKNREVVLFNSMSEIDLIREREDSRFNKIKFPSNERLELLPNEKIVESVSSLRKISGPVKIDTRDRIIEIERFDEQYREPEVKELKRQKVKSPYLLNNGIEIIKGKTDNFLIHKKVGDLKENSKKREGYILEKKNSPRAQEVLRPIEKDMGVVLE